MSCLSYKFDRPETIYDRAKMNLASHRAWRLSRNYFEACKPDSFSHCAKNYLVHHEHLSDTPGSGRGGWGSQITG